MAPAASPSEPGDLVADRLEADPREAEACSVPAGGRELDGVHGTLVQSHRRIGRVLPEAPLRPTRSTNSSGVSAGSTSRAGRSVNAVTVGERSSNRMSTVPSGLTSVTPDPASQHQQPTGVARARRAARQRAPRRWARASSRSMIRPRAPPERSVEHAPSSRAATNRAETRRDIGSG